MMGLVPAISGPLPQGKAAAERDKHRHEAVVTISGADAGPGGLMPENPDVPAAPSPVVPPAGYRF
jgi:hypothetical protein